MKLRDIFILSTMLLALDAFAQTSNKSLLPIISLLLHESKVSPQYTITSCTADFILDEDGDKAQLSSFSGLLTSSNDSDVSGKSISIGFNCDSSATGPSFCYSIVTTNELGEFRQLSRLNYTPDLTVGNTALTGYFYVGSPFSNNFASANNEICTFTDNDLSPPPF